MKYSPENALAEIMKRKEKVKEKRERRTGRILAEISATLSAVLVAIIMLVPGRSTAAQTGTVMGSFLLSAEAGGYVLASVIAFILGVVVTVLCYKIRKRNKASGPADGEGDA